MAPRPCLNCGTLTSNRTRCATCESEHQSARNQRRVHYHGDWQRTSKQARDAWVNEHGWVCPGYGRQAHPATDLTVDHVTPRDDTTLTVLCRSCNSRKGNRTI
jgi:5-methylcytosine-specific restriction protein A